MPHLTGLRETCAGCQPPPRVSRMVHSSPRTWSLGAQGIAFVHSTRMTDAQEPTEPEPLASGPGKPLGGAERGAERTPDATPHILQVMSEPVRWRAYALLHGLGPQRAARLARRLSVSEASVLKHLRLLQNINFVTSNQPELSERQRLWQVVPGGLRLTGSEESADAEAMRRWMQVFVQAQHLILGEWVETEHLWPLVWRQAALNYDHWLHLTASELQEFTDELHATCQRWSDYSETRAREGGSPTEEISPVYVVNNAVPVAEDPR